MDLEDDLPSPSKTRLPRLSPKKQMTPKKSPERIFEKKNAQRVGFSLRTILKLPKAHKWVCYEWFYANIDQPLFLGENDFQLCLKESFPQLKTRLLRKVEWAKIRHLMGKPRRCSAAFFAEERAALNAKRQKIRQLQQQKIVDLSQFRDLPPNIPLSLVIGTRVTALLRHPSDGLFTGTIDAVDATNGSYRITFDRPGIGSHPVPDYEVLSNQAPEFIPLTSFQTKVRPRLPLYSSPRFLELLGNQVAHVLDADPLISGVAPPSNKHVTASQSAASNHVQQDGEGTLGGFPIKFLALLVRLSKILTVKKKKIYELKSMNCEAEKLRCLREPIPHEFQKQYAGTILELEKLNSDLNEYLKAVQHFSLEISADPMATAFFQPDFVRSKFLDDAKETVERSLGTCKVKNEETISLISHLLSIVLHLKSFTVNEVGSVELKSLNEALHDTRTVFQPENSIVFQNEVEIHVNHIQSSLSHLGNLGAFSESNSDQAH